MPSCCRNYELTVFEAANWLQFGRIATRIDCGATQIRRIGLGIGPPGIRTGMRRSQITSIGIQIAFRQAVIALTVIVIMSAGRVMESIGLTIVTACLRIESSSDSISINVTLIAPINAGPEVIGIVRLAEGILSVAILACHGVGDACALALSRRSFSCLSAIRSFIST